jgi:hypothetical protein
MAKQQTLKKEWYKLIRDVEFSNGLRKAGRSVRLTEEGRKYFKSQNFIE